ncbi:mitochondrial dynamics protein MID49 [Rhinophrynus dorsalis]
MFSSLLSVKMAEMQLRKKGKKSDDGFGSMVDFLLANARLVLGVGGAAMLGIATLAVKRLIDRAASPPDEKEEEGKAEQKSIEESWKEAVLIRTSPILSQKANHRELCTPMSLPEPCQPASEASGTEQNKPSEVKKIPICFTLQERLLDYCTHGASIPGELTEVGRQLALDIMAELQVFLNAKLTELPFSALQLGGSLGSCLPVTCLDHACFILPLVLEPELWTLLPGQQTILNDPQLCMVKRVDLEYTVRGSSPWDKFLVGGYLSSRTIVESLHKTIDSLNWPAISTVLECTVRPNIASDDLRLEVQHPDVQMTIRILPLAYIKNMVLLTHCSSKIPAENLWQQSFYKEEIRHLQELDSADAGVRQQCIQILKGICRDCPSLRQLTATHLRHTILHLGNDSCDWSEAALADRFLQVVEELIGYLDKGFLPCYFDGKVNLFSCLSDEDIDELGYGLYQLFSEPDAMLKK